MAPTFWHYRRRAITPNRFPEHAALQPSAAGFLPSLSRHLSGLMVFWAMAGLPSSGEAPGDAPPFTVAPIWPTIALLLSSGLTTRLPAFTALPKATRTGSVRA